MFNLLADPRESANVAALRHGLAASLRHRLAEHRAASEVGVHLWLVNADDERSRRVEGTLRATGRFGALRALQLEAGDEAQLSEDGRRLVFRLELRNFPTRFPSPPGGSWTTIGWSSPSNRPTRRSRSSPSRSTDLPLLLPRGRCAPRGRADRAGSDLGRATRGPYDVAFPGDPGGLERGSARRLPGRGAQPCPVVVLDPAVEERLRALGYAN